MSDQKSNPSDQTESSGAQQGEVRDVDAPEVQEDTTSGGTPEEPE